jgi:UDP-N-acetylglucosamine:LPS N-acetylglucosamine transferase
MRFLVVSASMGGGHDGAARELQRRLERDGHRATVVDFLYAMPPGAGAIVRSSYKWELRFMPWLYEATYRLWYLSPSMAGPLVALISLITDRRMRSWCEEVRPDAIVSTYPLASLVLGRDRQRGRLDVPVATFITDFAVHPLWTHPGVDEHLCVHPQSAAQAAKQAGGRASAPGPLVPERFTSAIPSRDEARAKLGLSSGEKVVLLVAGSWGVGDIGGTFDDVLATGRYTPLAVCGRNERLRRKLEARGAGHVFGWTDDMPTLVAASDVLVQNAGGLSCMEAFAAGLPVVSYRPIAGHGRENALDMEKAGVAAYAKKSSELASALDEATGEVGKARAAAGRAMFSGDAAASAIRLATDPVPRPVPLPVRSRPLRRAAAAIAASVAMVYAALTLGVGAATARGIGVVHQASSAGTAYVAVRLGPAAIDDPAVAKAMANAHLTAIVDGSMATEHNSSLKALKAAGVDLANGGWGHHTNMQWRRARADLRRAGDAIRTASGAKVQNFVPVRRVDGFDLAWARIVHEKVIVANTISRGEAPDSVKAGDIYVVDAHRADAQQTLALIQATADRFSSAHVATASLAAIGQ